MKVDSNHHQQIHHPYRRNLKANGIGSGSAAGSSKLAAITIIISDDDDGDDDHHPDHLEKSIKNMNSISSIQSKGKGKEKGKEKEKEKAIQQPQQASGDHDDDDSETDLEDNQPTTTSKRKREKNSNSNEKLKDLGNGIQRGIPQGSNLNGGSGGNGNDDSNNKGKDKGKSRAISPDESKSKSKSKSRNDISDKDSVKARKIVIDDSGSDSDIIFKGSRKKKKSKPSNNNSSNSIQISSSPTPIASSSKSRLQSNSNSKEKGKGKSKEIQDPFKDCLQELFQIFPEIDSDFAKKHLGKVFNELKFTNKGKGNEMVLSRALEQLMNLNEPYPKKKLELRNQNSDDDDDEDGLLELSETEDEDLEGVENIPCGCCFDDEIPFKKLIPCSTGLHHFCSTCCRKTYETQLGLRKIQIQCMDSSNCEGSFNQKEIKKFLPKKQLKLLENLIMEKEIENAGLKEGLEKCPFCDFGCIIERSLEEEKLFRCQGRDCGRISCRSCKEEEHLPKSCKEHAESKSSGSRHKIEEALTSILIRKCPTENCGTVIVKEDGCNKICCPKCNKNMCYICKVHIQDYSHFDQNPSDYGKPKDTNKCPLWENTDERHKKEQDEYKKSLGVEEALKDVGGSAPIMERPLGWEPHHIRRARMGGYRILPNGGVEADNNPNLHLHHHHHHHHQQQQQQGMGLVNLGPPIQGFERRRQEAIERLHELEIQRFEYQRLQQARILQLREIARQQLAEPQQQQQLVAQARIQLLQNEVQQRLLNHQQRNQNNIAMDWAYDDQREIHEVEEYFPGNGDHGEDELDLGELFGHGRILNNNDNERRRIENERGREGRERERERRNSIRNKARREETKRLKLENEIKEKNRKHLVQQGNPPQVQAGPSKSNRYKEQPRRGRSAGLPIILD